MSASQKLSSLWGYVRAHERVAWWIGAWIFALAFGHGLLANIDRLGWGDWDQFSSQSVVAERSVLQFGQLPQWSPYHCGGSSLVENFQSRAWSPSLLLVLYFGASLGNRLWMLLALCLGFEGMRRLSRALGAGHWGAVFAAFAVTGNGAMTARMAVGHFGDVPYLFISWWLLSMHLARRKLWLGTLWGGLWGALCYLEAGIYPLVYGSIVALCWSAVDARHQRSTRPLLAFGSVGLASALLCMHVLWPSSLFMASHVRAAVDTELMPPSMLGEVFFSTDFDWHRQRFAEQDWRWYEFGAFVGPVFFLGLALALWRGDRNSWWWTGLGALFVWYGLGDVAAMSPWSLLHELPVFGSMRASGRAFVVALFCFSVAASLSIDRLRRAAPLLVVALGVALFLVSPRALDGAFVLNFPKPALDAEFTQRVEDKHMDLLYYEHRSAMTRDIMHNRGALSCYDPIAPVVRAKPLWPTAPEVLIEKTSGRAHIVRWSPNVLTVEVSKVKGPGLLLVNQNYHRGWRIDDGRPVIALHGVLGTQIRPGDGLIRFRFQQPGLLAGLLIALLSLGALAMLAYRERRRAATEG